MKKEELKEGTAQQQEQQPTKNTWDKSTGFQFPADLVELFNAASRLNALFVRQTDIEYERWRGYCENPDFFCRGFAEAMEHCTKAVQELSEYAKQLVQEEMFEKYKD